MLYIGDNWEKDFSGAQQIGMQTVGIKDENNLYYEEIKRSRVKPKYIIKNLIDLKEIVNSE